MYINKDLFEEWMNRILEKCDKIEHKLDVAIHFDKSLGNDILLDSQDIMTILKISRRTLQRLRNNGLIPYKRLRRKNYFLRSEVIEFIKQDFGREPSSEEEN